MLKEMYKARYIITFTHSITLISVPPHPTPPQLLACWHGPYRTPHSACSCACFAINYHDLPPTLVNSIGGVRHIITLHCSTRPPAPTLPPQVISLAPRLRAPRRPIARRHARPHSASFITPKCDFKGPPDQISKSPSLAAVMARGGHTRILDLCPPTMPKAGPVDLGG